MDDLDARLRDLRPDDIDRYAPLSTRVERHRRGLDHRARASNTARRNLVFMTAAAVLVIFATVFGVFRIGADHAYALTPPQLNFEQDDRGLEETVRGALSSLANAPGPLSAERRSSYIGWFAQIDMDKKRSTPVAIAPEVVTLAWHEDLSAEQTVAAGSAHWADPEKQEPVGPSAPEAGTVLSETRFAPGEFGVPDASLPGDSADDMRTLLTSLGLPDDGGAGDVMESIDSVLSLWTLTNQQHARLLEMFLVAGDVELLGTAIDRADRQVVGLRAEPRGFPGTSRTLLISAETGRIVGIETTRTTAEPPLEAGDVVAYKLWEVSP